MSRTGDAILATRVDGLGVDQLGAAEAGRLLPLFDERLKAEFAHYLVYPPRSEQHAGLLALRDWLLQEARDYTSHDVREKVRTPAAKQGRRK